MKDLEANEKSLYDGQRSNFSVAGVCTGSGSEMWLVTLQESRLLKVLNAISSITSRRRYKAFRDAFWGLSNCPIGNEAAA